MTLQRARWPTIKAVRSVSAALLALAVLASPLLASESPQNELPENLVVDVRLFEARSVQPDYQAMRELSFFIATDGSTVSDPQWLATIARKVPDSYLATLAFDRRSVTGSEVRFSHEKRSRELELRIDLTEFATDATFEADVSGRLLRGGQEQRSFSLPIELRLNQTYVVSGDDLELSASDYLSHFRDYDDGEHRGLLYEALRDYSIFLILSVTLRMDDTAEVESSDLVRVELSEENEIPDLFSPMPVTLVGTVELELDLDASGAPERVRIVRSSVPEVNPRILGEAPSWRFDDAAGKRVHLEIAVRTEQ